MSDRDVPSVPVTTLAGLASLSDLLSELPVSDSISSITSLNKSLLFHTLVAEESNNLLSVRDDNLVRQLVHAIEQTNSDHIELKSQYAVSQHGTNISGYPELLQGIYTHRPTVFNTPSSQRNQNHQFNSFGLSSVNSGHQQNTVQQSQHNKNQQLNQNDLLVQQQQIQPQPNIVTRNKAQILANTSLVPNNGSLQFVQSTEIAPQQQGNSVNVAILGPVNQVIPNNTNAVVASPLQTSDTTSKRPPTKRQLAQQQVALAAQQQQQTALAAQQQQQAALAAQQQQQAVLVAQQQQQATLVAQQHQQAALVAQQQQAAIAAQHQQQVQQQQDGLTLQNQVSHIPLVTQQQPGLILQQSQLIPNSNVQQIALLQQSPQIIQQSIAQAETIAQLQQTQQQVQLPQQQLQQNQPAHQQFQQQFVLHQQHQRAIQQTQPLPNQNHPIPLTPTRNQNQHQLANPLVASQHSLHQQQQQKTIPRNNEYLEQQSKNFDIRGPSPAQASVAPESAGVYSTDTPSTTFPAAKAVPKVCLSRIKAEDAVLMQQSLKEFAKKSPELARKLGLTEGESQPIKMEEDTTPVVTAKTEVRNEDMFTQMKADERRGELKRKLAIKDELTPEQILSKPKLRKVERMTGPMAPKSSKEDMVKSQTYQQFIKNMDSIIEQLDDTESPNFNSDEIDENIECIPGRLLTQVSNDVAKLKAKGVVDHIPKNKLTLLINYAMRNVYLAKNYSAGPDVDEEMTGDDVMEKILKAMEACLLVCNIYSTATDLKFLQEDNISYIVKFVQFQFRETIFPSYDPVYTVKNMKKMESRKTKKQQLGHGRSLNILYSKSVELMKVFVTLFDKCLFVDTIVLALSTLAVEPFFVDNIETLQFVCLELVTTIFKKEQYVKMRSSILNDILASIDRLPCSKKNLRPFKLVNHGGSIQMVTALVLQLIQCATVLPEALCDYQGASRANNKKTKIEDNSDPVKSKIEKDLMVSEKFTTAMSIGGHFLNTFLSKCKTRLNDTDFRPLFENFIHDLLATVNKPEWPAAELLLSLLGTLLVTYMSDKNIEQSIRLASLDYLGIVAARLRKDTVESRCKVPTMDLMIKSIKAEQEKEGDLDDSSCKVVLDEDEERTEFLQNILLDFLAVNAQEENLIWDYARHFYMAQWYKDVIQQRKKIADGQKGYASRKKIPKKKSRNKDSSEETTSEEEDQEKSDDEDDVPLKKVKTNTQQTDQELNLEIFRILEDRKKYLLGKIRPYSDINCASQQIKTYIDYNNAHLIAQYLASRRQFSQSFDKYLQKIILVVREPAIAIRTRAMKCLANIVEVDPLILKRKDMQMGVNQKFLDTAISVREAAVDLVGKYVLSSEELIDQYYEMLSTRILDTGVSVRKRVIKILRDICVEYPDFEKIPEICVKMIRRVNDEEGIQKLVTEVFMRMWFTPCRENDRAGIHRKISQIIDVVNTSHDTGTTWLDGLLKSIFAPKEMVNSKDIGSGEIVKKNTEPEPAVVLACQQLADGLVERLIQLEDTDNSRMLGCVTTIHLLAKVRPQLLVRHAITIEPYLNIKCHSTNAPKFISAVAEILEQVVPLMEHPSDTFLATVEEHLMVLIISLNQSVVLSCMSCLGAVVNKLTKNYKLIRDCFVKFYRSIASSKDQLANNPNLPIENIYQPFFRRSLYTIGILMRYFDFKSPAVLGENQGDSLPTTICDDVFDCIMYFLLQCPNFDIRKQALNSLGSFCIQNDEYLTRPVLKECYTEVLTSQTVESHIKQLCMRNILMYLEESEAFMYNKEKDWQTQSLTDDLKEMNDVSSGMASRIIQLYLTEVLNCFLHRDSAVRLWAIKVVQTVQRQGLVHPVRMVPYLICLSTDNKQEVAHRADSLLKEIDKTYSGYVNMKLQQGLQLSYELQEILQFNETNRLLRGYSIRDEQPVALNDFLYTLLRSTKPQRRALVQTVTKQFDDQKTTLKQMLYLADNLAYFPYIVQDEPLYLIHQIDILISVTGTNLLANFKEGLKPQENGDQKQQNPLDEDDDDEDKEILLSRLPEDTSDLQKCITASQGCMLLLILKQHLKDMYGLTDGKISRYSPSEPKVYEKAIQRKLVAKFNPKATIEIIRNEIVIRKELNDDEKKTLIDKYLDFKQLMLKLDPDDNDSADEDAAGGKKMNNSLVLTTPSKVTATDDDSTINQTPEKTGDSVHINNVNNTVSTPQKDVPNTPSARNTKTVPKSVSSSARKQPPRSKRKKKKYVLSSDDEESDCTDSDYA